MLGKKITISLIVLAVLAVVFFSWQQADENNQPVALAGPAIEIASASHDFGVVKYGEVVSHNFVVKNNGNKPLQITKLSTSCGCTSAKMADEDKIIPPGESREVQVSFDPAVHKDDGDLGELTRIIYIKSNDPDNPEAEAQIFANVIKPEKFKTIEVIAKQWEFLPNSIRVKEGDYIRLEIESEDVKHSFALPDFNINEDINPGKTTVIEFLADKKRTYDFRCRVLCGQGHSQMKGQLIIE